MSSTPPWTQHIRVPAFPALDANTKCDVCVVGAGIAGLTTYAKLVA